MNALIATIVVCTNVGFTVAFDTERNLPVWAQYDLAPSNVVRCERTPIRFRQDPRCGTDMEAFYRAHREFDRGHLVPAADMNWDTNALRQTYLYSNVCPMERGLNRGDWRNTEAEVRKLAESGTVHVVIVPVYWYRPRAGKQFVPEEFVKVAYGDFGARCWRCTNGTGGHNEKEAAK